MFGSFDMSTLEVGDIITVAATDDAIERFVVEHIKTYPEGHKDYSISRPYGIVNYSEKNLKEYLRMNALSVKKPLTGLELI